MKKLTALMNGKTAKEKWIINSFLVVLEVVMFWLIFRIGQKMGTDHYTFDWVLHRKLYLFAVILMIVSSVFGRWRFACSVFAGVFLGILCGERFGPNPAGAMYGFGHYGWLIWLVFFAVSILLGVLLELFHYFHVKRSGKS